MKKADDSPPSPRDGETTGNSRPLTKTRLRRGMIGRQKRDLPCAEIIDFLPAVHGDIEDILFDLTGEQEGGPTPSQPAGDS